MKRSEAFLSPNQLIIDELSKLSKIYKAKNDKWRTFGYEKAINIIRQFPNKIEDPAEVKNVRGLGQKMADKIAEILENGKLEKRVALQKNDKFQIIECFTKIWGVGPSTAEMLYYQGYKSIDDLRSCDTLTNQQKIGLKHFEDLNQRMTRDEATKIYLFVEQRAKILRNNVEVIACGSYRRGKENCGDVDIMVTHKDSKSLEGLFDELLTDLHKHNFLTDDLTLQKDGNQRKYLGVCKLPGDEEKHRRIDIIVVPHNEKACALMYFTGSAHFNRSMRLLAIKKGMSLSEHALRKNVIRDGKEKLGIGDIVPTPTEESIFENLGLLYRSPEERNH